MRAPYKLLIVLLAATTVGVSLIAGAASAAALGPEDCPTVFAGARTQAHCADTQPSERHDQVADAAAIERAKTDAANVYAAYQEGEATFADVRRADELVNRLTGEVSLRRSILAATSAAAGAAVLRDYMPFRQINWYYCGPATVQSMLWQLKSSEREVRAEGSDEFLALTGDPFVDQTRLASESWLSTEAFGGTPWGDEFIPRTLNTWMGSHWYVGSGTPNVDGKLTQDQALRNIRYAIDRGYPVAANVIYSPDTYYPAGFYPGVTYAHWDTIYGYGQQDGRTTVNVGQVYASDGTDYQPRQQVDWNTHWNAIGSWYGIVW